jgi:hypothetical protein
MRSEHVRWISGSFQVRACREPQWPSSPTQGGPWVRQWAAAATDATYENTPAAIIWHIYLP